MQKIIQRGAEAIIYLRGNELVKERIAKRYRIPQLDFKIRRQRTKSEAKLMERVRSIGLAVPHARIENDFKLVMEYVKGERLKDVLNQMDKKEREKICEKIGLIVAKLHKGSVVHGDLTTSNMILKNGEIYLIDFGLGKFSNSIEDFGVDLFLLYEALKSTHFEIFEECWEIILNVYTKNYSKAKEVIARIEKIKKRRRYK
ncbi:MAG: KEOPS complex kinase/ATPase Bud32 [Candidatus Aenigmatarchaeota archaeon]